MKTCFDCAYFDLDMGEPDYSEYTPGSPATIECRKGKFSFNYYTTRKEARKLILSAETCDKFKQVEE